MIAGQFFSVWRSPLASSQAPADTTLSGGEFMFSPRFIIGLIGVTVLLGPVGREASAEGLGTVRIVSPNAAIMSRPALKSDVFIVASAGTLLDTLDREGDWYWVVLPADVNGTRYTGWIHTSAV